MKSLLYAIELNLILWFLVFGISLQYKTEKNLQIWITIGFLVSGLVQHWAYYKVKSKFKDDHSQ